MCAGRRVMWCDVLHAHVSVTYTCQHTRTARGRESRARAAFSRAAFASRRGRGHAAPASRACVCTAHPSATTRLQCCQRMAARTPRPHRGRRSGVIPPGRRAPADRRARWSAVPFPAASRRAPRVSGCPGHPARGAGRPAPPPARTAPRVAVMQSTRDDDARHTGPLRGSGRYWLVKKNDKPAQPRRWFRNTGGLTAIHGVRCRVCAPARISRMPRNVPIAPKNDSRAPPQTIACRFALRKGEGEDTPGDKREDGIKHFIS